MTGEMGQNSPYPSYCRHDNTFRGFMRTCDTRQIAAGVHVIFAEKVESDGTRLELTPLEAPWRSGKTERAGKDWKEDYYKMTQDGPEAQT